MDQDKHKKFLAHTLMYHSIFSLDHFEKCETNCSRKRKITRPIENFFKPYCSKNPKPSYKNITIVGLPFCIRALKVQICKSYVSYQKYVSVPKKLLDFFIFPRFLTCFEVFQAYSASTRIVVHFL